MVASRPRTRWLEVHVQANPHASEILVCCRSITQFRFIRCAFRSAVQPRCWSNFRRLDGWLGTPLLTDPATRFVREYGRRRLISLNTVRPFQASFPHAKDLSGRHTFVNFQEPGRTTAQLLRDNRRAPYNRAAGKRLRHSIRPFQQFCALKKLYLVGR